MIEAELLSRAVARGIISGDQALALERLAREGAPARAAEERDDERLRFITGFADIFVTIGLALFLGASHYFGMELLGAAGGSALVAALSWGLAEFFARRRRMALPSIVLLTVFAASSFRAIAFALFGGARLDGWTGLPAGGDEPLLVAGAALATLGLVTLHYRRFGVPITIAAGAAATAGVFVALAFAAFPEAAKAHLNGLMIVAGLGIFALAMRFDLSDRERLTRSTDIAFWLHLLAAPLIVHPVLSAISVGGGGVAASSGAALMALAVVLALALVALATDRRAILVSGLTYAAYAFGTLIREAGFTSQTTPLSILALGAFVLLLSAGWQPLRRLALRALPPSVAARLPHPIGAR